MAKKTYIHAVIAARTIPRVGFCDQDGMVQLWDLETRSLIRILAIIYTVGGSRVAIHPNGSSVVSGAWWDAKDCVRCYDAESGAVLWTRDDLKRVTKVWFSETGRSVYCITDNNKMEEVEASSGKRVSLLTSAAEVVIDEERKMRIAMRPSKRYVLSTGQDVHLVGPTKPMLCGVFGDTSLCVSEMGGPTYNYDNVTGQELWRFMPMPKSHVLRLWYRTEDACFYAVNFKYDGKPETGLPTATLLRIQESTGETAAVCGLTTPIADMCPSLAAVVVSTGEIISLLTGEMLGSIPIAGVSPS